MKILLISPTITGIGGISNHVKHLKKWLIRKDNEVYVISSENTPIIRIKGLKNLSFMITASFKTVGKKFDIVHAHNVPSALPMRFSSGKKILTLHGFYVRDIELIHNRIYSLFAKKMEKRFLGYADKITAVSKAVTEYYRKMGYDSIYIPNAVDLEDIPESSRREYDKQVVFAGRLSKEKGVDILIKAFSSINDAHLLIIGDGPERERLQILSRNYPNIHFLGLLPNKLVLEYIKGSDIYVQPSRTEGLPTVILEAMACKTPVIATKIEGSVEIIDDGMSGILVEPGDIEALRENIRILLEDRKKAIRLAENAYKNILEKYNWNVVSEQYINLYRKVLE